MKLESFNYILRAKLVSKFDGIDPICDNQPIFDAYLESFDTETFIEVISASIHGTTLSRDRLYFLMNKLYMYKKISNKNVIFVLLLIEPDEEELANKTGFDRARYDGNKVKERYTNYFLPAINSGLLRIEIIKFPAKEFNSLYEERA